MCQNKETVNECLLNAIESEMALIIDLRRKYQLGFKLYDRVKELIVQQEDVRKDNYWLERRNLDDNCEMVTAYFSNGTNMSYRHSIPKATENEMREIV